MRRTPSVTDVVVLLLAAAELVGLVPQGWRGVLAGVVAALGTLVLLLRDRWPVQATVLPFVGLTGALVLVPHEASVVFIGLMVTFGLVGATASTPVGVAGWATGEVLVVVSAYTSDPGSWAADAALTSVFCSVMWGAGWMVGHRTRQVTVARLRAEAAELAGELALRKQRDQLARELHDVVSHGLSVVVLQTSAARTVLADRHDPEDVDRHLAAVEDSARGALDEMRRMLGLLQSRDLEEASALARPSLEEVLDRARGAGLRLEPAVDRIDDLPPGLALTVHRVLQEALTNAAKHAPGSQVRVGVAVTPDRVEVEVVDDGAAATPSRDLGGGNGLPGMAERIALYGGSLHVAPEEGGGFVVRARIPRNGRPARGALPTHRGDGARTPGTSP